MSEIEFDHSRAMKEHISGGIQQVLDKDQHSRQRVDGIFTSPVYTKAMKEGTRQVSAITVYETKAIGQIKQTVLTGVAGQKVDLEYKYGSMTLCVSQTTAGIDDDNSSGSFKKPSIYESIKPQSRISNPEGTPAWNKPADGETAKVTADVQSAKLKQLLGQIKQT